MAPSRDQPDPMLAGPSTRQGHGAGPEASSASSPAGVPPLPASDRPLSGLGGFVFEALTREPSTGVAVVTGKGQILYLNDQAARIFHGPDATARSYLGRFWSDHMPPEWTRERLDVLASIAIHGKPVLMRTVWRDFQHFTWIYPIEPEEAAAIDPREDLFLTITRRAASDEEAERLTPAPDQFEQVDSGVMRLKKLNSLSPRELEVLALLGQGLSVAEVASILHRSEKTIDNHRTAIHAKLKLHDRAELVHVASRAGLTLDDAGRERV